jgi:uncharacterized protein (TIGR03435 family)
VKLFGLIVLLGLAFGFLLNAKVSVGDRAPEIHLDKLLPEQPVANASLEALAGKAVVLEVWATWCGPCVGAIPHLNELAEKFKEKPIVFLSVTDEEPSVVEPFLKKRPISGLVGIAPKGSLWKLFGIDGIPATFLIDSTGKVAGITHPEPLSASVLENLMAGRPLSLPKPFDFSVKRSEGDTGEATPLLDFLIRPSHDHQSSGMRTGRNSLTVKGMRLRDVLAHLYSFQRTRIAGEALDDAAVYDMSLSVPGLMPPAFQSLAREVVSNAFHIKVTHETRDTDVWVLTKTDEKPSGLAEATEGNSSWNAGGGKLKMMNSTISSLAQAVEAAAENPVLDETGITGKYDLQLTYDKDDPEGPAAALRKLGFKVESARRPIEFLVVSKAE